MSPEEIKRIIKQLNDRGWTPSHTATAKGCVFEASGANGYVSIAVYDASGELLSSMVLDKWAVEAGVASVAVNQLFKKLNGMAK